MKNYLIPLLIFFAFVSCEKEENFVIEQEPPVQDETQTETFYEEGVSIVKLNEEMTAEIEAELQVSSLPTKSSTWGSIVKELGIRKFERLFPYDERFEERQRRDGLHQWYKLTFDEQVGMTKASMDLSAIPGVELVEPQMKIEVDAFDDPYFNKMWNLSNHNITGGKEGFDINVEKVWKEYTTGSPKVIVGVVDGGIQPDHPDLEGVVIPGGNNGSYNFVDQSTIISPHKHGTHVGGTIGAISNNGIGVSGIAGGDYAKGIKGVRLLSCQIFKTEIVNGKEVSKGGGGPSAIVWAANHGATICQNSWGYVVDTDHDGKYSEKEMEHARKMKITEADRASVDYFIKNAGCDNEGNQLPDSPMKGGVVFFSAGNDGLEYGAPANYAPIISVASVDKDGRKSFFSNWGDWVDIAAPGTGIYSTYPPSRYSSLGGTSMACPHVSGVAALVLSYNGGLGYTNKMLEEAIIKGANRTMFSPMLRIGPMLDALGAISYGSEDQPVQPEYTHQVVSNNVEFKWKHVASPKGIGAYGYRLLASRDKEIFNKIDLNNLPEGVISYNLFTPKDLEVGSDMSARLTGLDFDTEYYVSVMAYGYGGKYLGEAKVEHVRTSINNPPVIRFDCEDGVQIRAFEEFKIEVDASDKDGHDIELTFDDLFLGTVSLQAIPDKPNHFYFVIDANTFEPGIYQTTFHAKDIYGGKDDKNLNFEILENRAPVQIKPFDFYLATKIDEKFEYKISDYIADPDDEPLTLSYEITNPGMLDVEYVDGLLKFRIKNYGMAYITLIAKDVKGKSITSELRILARKESEKITLFPNPVSDVLHIRTGKIKEEAKVEILSNSGKVVYRASRECSAFEPMKIGVSNLAPGVYQVKVSYGETTDVKSVIKK